jgi:hypothetical protein
MANTKLTADIIAKEALLVLTNELDVLDTLYRAPEDEFSKDVNGYKVGSTVSIRRPWDPAIRSGRAMQVQDFIEGKVTFTVDQQKGVDFQFTSTELTLDISDLSERVIRPSMVNLVNDITADVFAEFYRGVYNWVGTVANTVDSFADFYKGPERLNEMAVPMASRSAVLSPADHAGMLGNLTGLYMSKQASDAYERGDLPMIGGVKAYMSQVTPTHTVGPLGGSPAVNGANQNVTYDAAKNTWTQTLITNGWTSAAANRLKKGDVFTINNVFMVNPKTKVSTGINQQFVVMEDANSDGSGNLTVTISPPIITSGQYQTVNAAPGATATISVRGTANTAYKQNLVYHKNAMALAFVPLELPEGAYRAARRSWKGISVRVEPVRDGVNDISAWRLDVLYGRKLIDPRLATRLSGT